MGRFGRGPSAKKEWVTLDSDFSLKSSDGVTATKSWKINKVSLFTVEIKTRFLRGKGEVRIDVDTGTGLYNFLIPNFNKEWHDFKFYSGISNPIASGKEPRVTLTCSSKSKRKSYDNYGVKPDITEVEFEYIKLINAIK